LTKIKKKIKKCHHFEIMTSFLNFLIIMIISIFWTTCESFMLISFIYQKLQAFQSFKGFCLKI